MSKFIIPIKKVQKKSMSFQEIIKKDDLIKIARYITGTEKFEVIETEEKNIGKYIIYENQGVRHYICILHQDTTRSSGRNSMTQSLSTAYSYYLEDSSKKKIYFYSLNENQLNSFPPSIINSLKMAVTLGIEQIQLIRGAKLVPYVSALSLIDDKNKTRDGNVSNNPTFIEYSDDKVHVYGKVFGANAKDTELTLMTIAKITNKEVHLHQVMENKSKSLSKRFKEMAKKLRIFIDDEIYSFDEISNEKIPTEDLNLRNKNFIYNLYKKFGEKKCLLCNCKIDSLVQGAHILPVAAIKQADLKDDEKLFLATDGKNGVWLCQNHHKLFDDHLLRFSENGFKVAEYVNEEDYQFIKEITTAYENVDYIMKLEKNGLDYYIDMGTEFNFNFKISDNTVIGYIDKRNDFYKQKMAL